MARTPITLEAAVGPYPSLPVTADSADIAMTATSGSSGANGNQAAFGNFNRLLCLFRNSGAGAHSVTLSSVASANTLNRTGDISAYSIGAGETAAFLVERNGFVQSDGNLYFESDHAEVLAAIIGIQ